MDLASFFRTVDILSELDPDQVLLLADGAEVPEFTEGSVIIKRGEIGRDLWIVYEGKVEVAIQDPRSGEELVVPLGRGEILGEMSIMTGDPAIATVTAIQSCRMVKIPRHIISRVIAANPRTMGKFTKIITKRLIEIERYEEEKEKIRAAHRDNEDPYDLNFSSVSEPMKILVINSGSSSLKYSLFDTARKDSLIEGLVERIGSGDALHKVRTTQVRKDLPAPEAKTIHDAFNLMMETLTDPALEALRDIHEINAIGNRVVHGGQKFTSSVAINQDVLDAIKANIPLAPLHNPYNLEGIEALQKILPEVPQVAVFDTAFHRSIPDSAAVYALPGSIRETEQIRRYGFHGTNHRYVALSVATFLRRPAGELKIISCHLGSGASACAIDHGQSIDTSMGMTPLEGLMMGTRAGDLDPGILLHLMRHAGLTYDQLDQMLNRDSGLKGISGRSNDMREILQAAEAGDPQCRLAVGAFCYRVKKYIGSYSAALGGLDVLIFTGGIGENSAEIRARICQGLEAFGLVVYDDTNRKTRVAKGQIADISEPGSKVRILVVPADEERMIARETIHALGRIISKEDSQRLGAKPVPISTSAHHVHLSTPDFESLFGKGRTMTPRTELSQPGQFAAVETVNLIGPKGTVENVRILGPPRKESQVEISRTEQFKLGIDAPIRDSGDIEGTPGIVIEGKAGSVRLDKGVICAKRHIHMSAEEALALGLRDRDTVKVRVKGVRELIFGDVLVRVNPNYRMDMHLDTDEANAAQITAGTIGIIEAIEHRHYM